jgi:flagellar biosynthesis/type III secretory pathway chaperone
MCLYEELLDCLEEETHALLSAQEEAILAAAARKESLLDRLLQVKRVQGDRLQASATGRHKEQLVHLQRQVAAANARNREIVVTSLEVVQEFLAQFQPHGPGLYQPAGQAKSIQEGALFQRQA